MTARTLLLFSLLPLGVAAQAQTPPQVLARIAPALADTSTVEGDVAFRVFLDATGALVRIRIEEALRPDADSAAVQAVRMWRFVPARNANGDAVASALRVRLAFRPAPAAPLPAWTAGFDMMPHLIFGSEAGWIQSRTRSEWRSTGAGCRAATEPVKRSGADPQYPDQLRRRGQEGRVVVALAIGADGEVTDVHVHVRDDEAFVRATHVALRTWRFTPATCDGVPTTAALLVPVRFRTGTLGFVF